MAEEIRDLVIYSNSKRCHEALENVTPDDVYFGQKEETLKKRRELKQQNPARRKAINLGKEADPVTQFQYQSVPKGLKAYTKRSRLYQLQPPLLVRVVPNALTPNS